MDSRTKLVALAKKLLEIQDQLEALIIYSKDLSGTIRITEDRLLTEDSDVTPSIWDKTEFARIRMMEARSEVGRALTKVTEAIKLV